MHYYGNETIMSLEQVLRLRPNEVRILEWVRTYEFLENQYGLDDAVPHFLEIKCEADAVRIRRNRITDFPEYICEEEKTFPDVEQALALFHEWAKQILDQVGNDK
ncbi:MULTISPECIES: hypothetical protein [Brevibacillus]|uniref:hypothetical protein n=1 Tax=Brevibacillus TaxID=55080 RepID=UPI000469AE3A|nr:hypothetical protein [Brevibacillus borstelensis]KKX56386.1 hypothetical protein X546_04690 [Brevibacillus borstelensis cifa_chp40]MBE5394988.1 hypothetical protein [Brevibacillus borstelensis]MCC0563786.1 hypothetical protein [Brevibacillus borstelensis]MCM3473404.1 hypothetical protein [Brevibacillus borstelensis]MCM3559210.1 hypothetical protein [Brevibacillus borstelensis]